jgi:hypothetical protein
MIKYKANITVYASDGDPLTVFHHFGHVESKSDYPDEEMALADYFKTDGRRIEVQFETLKENSTPFD